ncbi:TSUP family transporter [Sphingomonas endophytica]|uniref:TSUP family transporter n=1 Tax=Sphingomonas endophytica TaxID=869719 RepID=UPI003D1594CB
MYVVGVGSPHAAIGTAPAAVTVNALASLIGHARAGRVKWRCARGFAVSEMIGAALGGRRDARREAASASTTAPNHSSCD